MEDLARQAVPSEMDNIRISIEDFIKLHNKGQCVFVDVRVAYETDVWGINTGLKIPADELSQRLEELPRDKMIVLACPHSDRSNLARAYLASKDYNARYLTGGLLGLLDYLKGGNAKKLEL